MCCTRQHRLEPLGWWQSKRGETITYYDIFASGTNGGKRFAVVDESLPESVMPEIAVSSQAPITAFITNSVVFAQPAPKANAPAKNIISVRFFTNSGKEKLESDSGALVVAHHTGASCSVQMQSGNLEVMLEADYVWTMQPDTHILPLPNADTAWLGALNLPASALETGLTVLCAGTLEKHNVIVPITEKSLEFAPNFAALADLLQNHQLNGCIAVSFISSRATLEYRFFAPHKGLPEDNAGAFSLASICGYLAAHRPSGLQDIVAAQGYTMQKPSELRARFVARDSTALAVRVGGQVQLVP